jgi:uncharacterized protein
MQHAISWFELAVADLERASAFYSAVLDAPLGDITDAGDRRFAMFSAEDGVSGALVQGERYKPSADGALIFLNVGDLLAPAIERVESAGGRVVSPRMEMGDWGVAAFIIDTEGNKVALHAEG